MPRNTVGGSKHKRKKNNIPKERKLDDIAKNNDPNEFEGYGIIVKATGSRRFQVCAQLPNKPKELKNVICSLKGSIRKRVNVNDYVLVKYFNYNTDQCMIVDNYTHDEVAALRYNNLWDYPSDEKVSKAILNNDLPSLPDNSDDSDESSEPDNSQSITNNNVRGDEDIEEDDIDIDNI